MKKLCLLAVLILIIGCNSTRKLKNSLSKDDVYISDKRIEKKEFYAIYKNAVFISSLQYSFNNSPEIRKLLMDDKSGNIAGELLDLEDVYRVAKIVSQRIKQDSVKSIGHNGDLAGKTVFKTCLEFYNSKELDSIANQLYKTKYSKPWILYAVKDTIKRNK